MEPCTSARVARLGGVLVLSASVHRSEQGECSERCEEANDECAAVKDAEHPLILRHHRRVVEFYLIPPVRRPRMEKRLGQHPSPTRSSPATN